jgi:hypothetical protein
MPSAGSSANYQDSKEYTTESLQEQGLEGALVGRVQRAVSILAP